MFHSNVDDEFMRFGGAGTIVDIEGYCLRYPEDERLAMRTFFWFIFRSTGQGPYWWMGIIDAHLKYKWEKRYAKKID